MVVASASGLWRYPEGELVEVGYGGRGRTEVSEGGGERLDLGGRETCRSENCRLGSCDYLVCTSRQL